jgi:hypothetical protein
MGRAKVLMMQEEQGWSFSDDQICSRYISEQYLKSVIKHIYRRTMQASSFVGSTGGRL